MNEHKENYQIELEGRLQSLYKNLFSEIDMMIDVIVKLDFSQNGALGNYVSEIYVGRHSMKLAVNLIRPDKNQRHHTIYDLGDFNRFV